MSCIEGKHYVITGRLEGFSSRMELEKKIVAAGAHLDKSVTAKTDALITNTPDSGTKKNRDAVARGIPIITEKVFCSLAGIEYAKDI